MVRPGVSYPEAYQPEGYLAADAAFGLLAVVAGVAITIGLANMRREHLASVLVAGCWPAWSAPPPCGSSAPASGRSTSRA